MENTTESAETAESVDTSTETSEASSTETTEEPYDAGYADDYSVPTENTAEEQAEANIPELSDEDMADNMMTYLKENYEMPDKFKDVGALINSYKHLEGKMGNMKGAPEVYQIDEKIFDSYSQDMLGSLTDTAREMGLDNDGMNKMLAAANKQSTLEADAKWEMEKHKLGQYADEELSDASAYLNANFTPEMSETLMGMVTTAEQFKALKTAVMSANKPAQPASNQASNTESSDADIQKMLFATDDFGNLKMETDGAYQKKVNAMMKSNW